MKEKTKVFEIQKIYKREEKSSQKFILEFNEELNEWVFNCPSGQEFTMKELDIIQNKLAVLNTAKSD
jgi:hypothetical protein